jgi:MATE family multidrug resistance protein
LNILKKFWQGDVGAKHILSVAIPLIMSTSSFSIMMFVDRKFLAGFSTDAFRAAAPAGMMSFTILSLFFGTAGYINTFIAQHFGAQDKKKVAAFLWQGLYFCLISWVILLGIIPFSDTIFSLFGHGEVVAANESIYFQILIGGSGFVLLNLVLSCFYSGQGKTWTIMWIRLAALAINLPLDYIMIYGKLGLPAMGIKGAGIATVISTAFTTIIFISMVFSKRNRVEFELLKHVQFCKDLFSRLLKFGLPNGMHFVVDVFGFTIFLMMVGRLGPIELAATNAAWSMNLLAFLPMVGFAITVSTLVGQSIGQKNIKRAKLATRNTFLMTFSYLLTMGILFVVVPRFFIGLLLPEPTTEEMVKIYDMAIIFLRFVATYTIFDSIALIFASAIKGAGDTNYVMRVSLVLSVLILVLPSIVFCIIYPQPGTVTWGFATFYMVLTSMIFLVRYMRGKWTKMSVIEGH